MKKTTPQPTLRHSKKFLSTISLSLLGGILFAQTAQVTGKIVDENRIPISEAEIIKVTNGNDIYVYFNEENLVEKNGVSLGKGIITIKLSKPKKAEENQFKIEVSLSPLKEKDSEITPFDSIEEKNEKIINDFLSKWVKEPHKILEKKEGCEINFNKVFPKKIEMRKSSDILKELAELDKKFGEI